MNYLRSKCQDVINLMPEEGLEECLTTLEDMYRFYTQPSAWPESPVKSPTLPGGQLVGTVDRPPLVIEDS